MKKLKLSNLYGLFPNRKQEKFILLQWGSKRSIIQNVTSGKFELFIVENQHLMNLDEQGIIL